MNLRKWHINLGILTFLPIILATISGILLLFRGSFSPSIKKVKEKKIRVSYQEIIKIAQEKNFNPKEIRIYPNKGNILLRNSNYQIQIDGSTGKVLSEGKRYVSFLISLHEGKIFSSLYPKTIFLVSASILIFIYFSGMILYFRPLVKKTEKVINKAFFLRTR